MCKFGFLFRESGEIRLEKTQSSGFSARKASKSPRKSHSFWKRVNLQEEGKCGNPPSHGIKQGAEAKGPIISEMAMNFKNS